MFRNALIGSIILLILWGSACAHGPQKVAAEFDLEEHMLTVTISHSVKDAGKHFVDEVAVVLNGKETVRQSFMAQETLEGLTVVYRITDAGAGDAITISAGCNISGKKKTTIKVEKKVKNAPEKGAQEAAEE